MISYIDRFRLKRRPLPVGFSIAWQLTADLTDRSGNGLDALERYPGTGTFSSDGILLKVNDYNWLEMVSPINPLVEIGKDSFSFGCQIRTAGGDCGIIGKSAQSNIIGMWGIDIRSGELRAYVQVSSGVGGFYMISTPIPPILDDTVHDVVAVYDRENLSFSLYVDGVSVGTTPMPNITTDLACNTKFFAGVQGNFGGTGGQSGTYYVGYIRNLFAKKSALTAQEVGTVFADVAAL